MVFQGYVAGKCGVVAHYNIVAEDAVVSDVAIGHQVIVGADYGGVLVFCRRVNRAVFAKDIVVANF